MIYCLNPKCPHPENPDQSNFCLYCGSKLKLGDRYFALHPLNNNTRSHTFLAIDDLNPNKSKCIIKQILPHNLDVNNLELAKQKWQQEVIKLNTLSQHPQIPKLLGYFLAEPPFEHSFFLVQQLIEGENLSQILNREGNFTEKKIRQLLREILAILEFIHSHNIIHRDINPDNIIYSKSGQLFLVDFSTAKITSKTALAKTGTLIGSVAYTAPEQLRGKATFASDIYSLGVVCIYLLTLVDPFYLLSSSDGIEMWQDYLTQPVSDQLRQIITKMIATALGDRYQSAKEIWQDLNPDLQLFIPNINNQVITSNPHWQCIATLTGHRSSIHCLSFSPDSQYLASGSADNTIKIWSLKSKDLQVNLRGHRSIIEAVIFSPDQKLIYSASWDYSIRIWDVETKAEIKRLQEHSGWIHSLILSKDGKILVSGSADNTIKIWQLETEEKPTTLMGHSGAIHSLSISPDNQYLASGSNDKMIKVWDLSTQQEIMTLKGHQDRVTTLVFSPSSKILISGSADKTIKIWRIDNQELLYTLCGHSDAVNTIVLNQEGNLLISGSSDQTVVFWHPSSGELVNTIYAHSAAIQALAISPDQKTIATASQDKTIKLWQFIS